MKQLNFLFFIVFLLVVKNSNAAETEPNNTKAQANTFALNGNNSGAINVAGDEDWYKVTTNADGMLNVTITVSNNLYLWCYLYDNDGTTLLSSGNSNSTTTVSKDGLAAGTYYIKLVAYYSGQLPAYTVANKLTVPAQANDVEPNDTKGQAKILPLNAKKTGHVNYYYNNKRDTSDWYKVTTNADGLLRLSLTPANGRYVWIYLYDNNGTTLLNSGNGNTAFNVSEDGLAAGTYYVSVKTYYNTDFAPYTLSDSLFTPAQANDVEPNDTKAQSKVLPLNGQETGHTGYYYNNQRDTSDWYKITTNDDGLLRLSLTPANGRYVWIYLYDNNGTTLLNSGNSNTAFDVSQDGLAAGTYYVCVKTYYNTDFAPYTLSNNLVKYNYTADEEPNKQPYNAKTITANGTVTGHAGFYYDNVRDSVDWWKINYTGSGNLSITINQEAWKSNNSQHYVWIKVYKDTLANPVYSDNSNAASWTANLTNLTQGYYYVKAYTYYNSEFVVYSLNANFTQVNIASIKPTAYDAVVTCSSSNSITFTASKSAAPYTMQLYRFGTPYGNPVQTSKKHTFDNLPTGTYYATVYGDGASGTAFGKSKTVVLEPTPNGLSTTAIKATQAKLNWNSLPCATYFVVHYKIHSTNTWTVKRLTTQGNITGYILKGLMPNTVYDWSVAAAETADGLTATGMFADSISFTTQAASLIADNEDDNVDDLSINSNKIAEIISVAPNPAVSYFTIHYNSSIKDKLVAALYDVNGKAVWTSGSINADALNGKKVIVSQFGNGVYYLKIINDKGMQLGTAKLVINK